MSRARKIALGTFIVLLAAAPFVPRGSDSDDSLAPSGGAKSEPPGISATTGLGRVTPAMQQEIDRVVGAGLTLGRRPGKQSPESLVGGLVRCAEFDGQRYCLHSGWTHRTVADVEARLGAAVRTVAARRVSPVSATGDLDALAALRQAASLTATERASAEREELTRAARSVAKVWLLRHEVEGVALPAGFLARHPEARVASTSPSSTTTSERVKHRSDYPRRGVVLRGRKVSAQTRTYWCGPTTMQMIAWAWQGDRKPQRHWARQLGTTTDGSAISDLVRVINRSTGWDRKDHAGPYITLDISDWPYRKWLLLNMRHVVDYRAPLVLHPVLLKKFYPYLDDDASGHFQVGRGYDKRGKEPAQISYFEPWNQQRFDPSEPYIDRVQWRSAYKSYRANRAHFQQNIGV